eukprot:gene26398-32382_t
MDRAPENDDPIKSFNTQATSEVDAAIPLGREDDVEASHDHSTYDADGTHDNCWEAIKHLHDNLQALLSRSTSRAQEIAEHYGRDRDDPLSFNHTQPQEPLPKEGYAANPHANANARSMVAAISSQDANEPTTDTDMLTVLAGGHLEDPDAHAAAATRGRHYLIENDILYRLLPNGQKRPVPEVAARADIAKHMHERNGHFGQRRTRTM